MVEPVSAGYGALGHLFSCLSIREKYIESMGKYVTLLEGSLNVINTRMKEVDQTLGRFPTMEKTDEYKVLVDIVNVLRESYRSFISDSGKLSGFGSFLNPAVQEIEAATSTSNVQQSNESIFEEFDLSSAGSVIAALQEVEPSKWESKISELAQQSQHIAELLDYVSGVKDKMKIENLIRGRKQDAYIDKVLSYLEEKHVKTVGILGPVGVGKTAVMKMLKNRLMLGDRTSSTITRPDYIIWTSLSMELRGPPSIAMMQDQILTQLKLDDPDLKNKTIDVKASHIHTFLRNKKYVLFIDQVLSNIDLQTVGVGPGNKFGKVVVASRYKKAINHMIDEVVEIQRLPESDAWKLFVDTNGQIIDMRIREIAEKIIESCEGLPQVIKLVAAHLKGKTEESEWSDVKKLLQSEPKAKLLKLGGVGNAYEMAYRELEDKMKKCSLYGALLLPTEHGICKDYLIECWMALGFLDLEHQRNLRAAHLIDLDDARKLRAARDRGHMILKELTSRQVLELCSSDGDNYLQMPFYCREFAKLQRVYAIKEDRWFRPMNLGLTELIHLLSVQKMNLKVLDLREALVKLLPSCISDLVNLACLYLNDCSILESLPTELEKLKNLQLLDIRGTKIPFLPEVIGSIVSLRCLRVSFDEKTANHSTLEGNDEKPATDPSGIIRKLKQLEELIVYTDFSNYWRNTADPVADAIASLENLTTLHFNFPTAHSLRKFVSSSKSWKNTDTHWGYNTFRSFNISVGCNAESKYLEDIPGTSAQRQLNLMTSYDGEIFWVSPLLKQADALQLIAQPNLKTLSGFHSEDLGALKMCTVERCSGLLNIVETSDDVVLESLVRLHLSALESLECIWKGPEIPDGSLSNLTLLTVYRCHKLMEVLKPALANALSSLRHLKVEDCSNVVKILMGEIDHGKNITTSVEVYLPTVLHKLETIELIDLPKLQSICTTSASVKWNSLLEIVILKCSKLKNLPFTPLNARMLALVTCEKSWWTWQKPSEWKAQYSGICHFTDGQEKGPGNEIVLVDANAKNNNSLNKDKGKKQGIGLGDKKVTEGGPSSRNHWKTTLKNFICFLPKSSTQLTTAH